MKKKRLLWQLYPSYLLITLISLVAATWFASKTLSGFFIEQTATDLKERAHLIERQIREQLLSYNEKNINHLCKKIAHHNSTRITIIALSGKVIGDSAENPGDMDNHIDRPEVIQAMAGNTGMSMRYSRTLQKEMMYVGIPVKRQSEIIGVVRTSIPLTPIDDTLKGIQVKIAFGGLLIAILAAIISLLVSRRISRPIEEIKKGAEHYARGDFQFRLPVSNLEEIGRLAETMNQMASELNDRINTIMRQRNELEAVFSSMTEGVIAVDLEERIISMNYAASQILGCDLSRVSSHAIQEVIRNNDLEDFVTHALSSEEPLEKDIVIYSEEELVLNGHATTLRDAMGESIGALIILNDVTRLRKLENLRRDFAANVSHEIKTPITAIKGFVETLLYGPENKPKDTERFLKIIVKHVDRLTALIEDLLSLSRIERGAKKGEIILQEENIRDVLQTAIQLCETKAAAKGIKLTLSCDKKLKGKINPAFLEQAVINLLDNAIKYSDKESTVNVESNKKNKEILINVHDHGCGIEKRHISRLFERFYRVDKARSRELGGTGLGLAIVKHITHSQGGHVTVESTPGKGSIFTLHLPVRS